MEGGGSLLKKYYADLVGSIHNPSALAGSLYSRGVISRCVRNKIEQRDLTIRRRNEVLINAVEAQVARDPSAYQVFMEVLGGEPYLSCIVGMMARTSSMADLMNVVATMIPAKWRAVGLQLGLSSDTLDGIHRKNAAKPHASLKSFELVHAFWKKHGPKPYTRNTIFDVIKTPAVGEYALAKKLSATYLEVSSSSQIKVTIGRQVSLADLMNDVAYVIPAKWRAVGLQLELSSYTLDSIHSANAGMPQVGLKSFEQVLSIWKRHGPKPYTWKTIVYVLRTPAVGESALAEKLFAKYLDVSSSSQIKVTKGRQSMWNHQHLYASMADLTNDVASVIPTKWRAVGIQLGLSYDTLDSIHSENAGIPQAGLKSFEQVLSIWKRHGPKPYTWKTIDDVLRAPAVGESALAEKLFAEYLEVSSSSQIKVTKGRQDERNRGLKDSSTTPLQGGGGDVNGGGGDGGDDDYDGDGGSGDDGGGSDGENGEADTKKLYDEAMRNGYVDREIIKCLIIGAAGVGKTTIKHLLLGKEPPEKRVSTGVLENPVRAVSISKAGECSSGSWCKVESDEELMKMIAEAIKSGKVPKKNISARPQNDAVAEHNDDIMLPATDIESSTVRPADVHIEPEYNVESIHSEFIEAINHSEGSETFLSTRWIHFFDSGGQPEFHDLLSLFIPNTSVVIFVFKLSESLHHKPKVEYVGSSGRIGDPYDSYLTHKEILEHSLKSFYEPSSQNPTIVVVGTHKDCEQKLEIEDLKKCLNHIKSSLVHFGSEPIALVDCLSQHGQEREDVIEGIRSSIMEAADKIRSQKTPLAWFGLEMELKRAGIPKAGILSIDECKKEANKFPFFKNNTGQFDAALKHLIEHNIFLYYPEILSNIVFCDPQVLLTEVTRIVQHHYMLKNSTRPRRGDMISFVQNGYISTNILKTINKDYGNALEPAVFLKLLSQLNIISAIHINDFYLMPALLSNTENPALTVTSITGKEAIPPLCIAFDGGCAPSGLFSSLVAHLLHSEDWKLYIKSGAPRCCFHNCVAFIYGDETIVTLMDLFTHFRIYVQTPPNDAPLTCHNIHDIVHTSIDAVHKKSKLKYVDTIVCPSHPEQNHVAMCSKHKSIYKCTDDEAISGPIPEEYKIWKNFVIGDQASVHQPSSSLAPSVEADLKPTVSEIDWELSRVTEWKELGQKLNIPDDVLVNVESDTTLTNMKARKRAVLKWWLDNDPEASWSKLAGALEGTHGNLATTIRNRYCSM